MAMATEHDFQFMQRALFLASLGMGKSSPHPLAGGIFVKNQKIIAEGWYEKAFSVTLLSQLFSKVSNKFLLQGSFLYVSTLYDTELLSQIDLLGVHKISGIVVANLISTDIKRSDLSHKLRKMGIEVVFGILEKEEKSLNHRYYYAHQHHIPYIILKWAETADGFIARKDYDSKWISNEFSRKIVHKWRAEEDAILVGTNTCQYDNPRLNVRTWEGNHPLRIVIDRHLRLLPHLHIFDKTQPTICYNLMKDHYENNLEFVNLSGHISAETSFIHALLSDLFRRNVQSLIIEGGSIVLHQFIQEGFWNEARIFKANHLFEQGIKAPLLSSAALYRTDNYFEDKLFLFKNFLKTE
jgi:diaminohydroxyphosphoribosylaminopyrimidine deaminase/5-amino-6-(5-phosphoribosylamino)uracil reductase